MAFANIINKDLTAADARAVASSISWQDIYPKDFDFSADPRDFLGERRVFFDAHKNASFTDGNNPFSGPLSQTLRDGEKDGLLNRGIEGKIRDVRARYGEPKEWDHITFGLTRAESQALGKEGIKKWAETIINNLQASPDGEGNRMMIVTPIHDDTDNIHIQVLLHRIPLNENNLAGPSYVITRNSEAATQMKALNTALEEAGLPMISDFRMGAFSVSEPRAINADELARASERLEELGGVSHPDLTTGPIGAANHPANGFTPEMRQIQAMVAEAVREYKEAETAVTKAGTKLATAQHAEESLKRYEAVLKEKHDILDELKRSQEETLLEKENREKLEEELAKVRIQIDEFIEHVSKLTEENVNQKEELNNINSAYDSLKETYSLTSTDLAEAKEYLSGLENDLTSTKDDLVQANEESLINQKKFENATKENNEIKSQLESTTANIKLLVDENNALKEASEFTNKKLDDTEKELADLKTKFESMAAMYKQIEDNLAAQKETNENFREVVKNNSKGTYFPPVGNGGFLPVVFNAKAKHTPKYPLGVKVIDGWFNTKFEAATFKLTGNNHGIKSDSTIDDLAAKTMIEYAKSKGWVHIQPTGSQEEIELILKHAAEAGISVEGYTRPKPLAGIEQAEPSESKTESAIAPAQPSQEPVVETPVAPAKETAPEAPKQATEQPKAEASKETPANAEKAPEQPKMAMKATSAKADTSTDNVVAPPVNEEGAPVGAAFKTSGVRPPLTTRPKATTPAPAQPVKEPVKAPAPATTPKTKINWIGKSKGDPANLNEAEIKKANAEFAKFKKDATARGRSVDKVTFEIFVQNTYKKYQEQQALEEAAKRVEAEQNDPNNKGNKKTQKPK